MPLSRHCAGLVTGRVWQTTMDNYPELLSHTGSRPYCHMVAPNTAQAHSIDWSMSIGRRRHTYFHLRNYTSTCCGPTSCKLQGSLHKVDWRYTNCYCGCCKSCDTLCSPPMLVSSANRPCGASLSAYPRLLHTCNLYRLDLSSLPRRVRRCLR